MKADPRSPWALSEMILKEDTMNAVVTTETSRDLVAQDSPASATPMQLVERAMAVGNLDLVEKFMALQERWEANQARKAFVAAISAAKAEIKPILKKQEVDFTSTRGRTNYEHEGLADIAEHVDPILAKNGLSYRYRPKQDAKILTITCIVEHRDGHAEETTLFGANDESGNKNAIQSVGSTATYLQRYTLKLALGLAAAKDDDGRGAGNGAEPPEPEAPEGYADWRADMTAKADEGYEQFSKVWKTDATKALREYALKHDREWRDALVKHAQDVDARAAERLK